MLIFRFFSNCVNESFHDDEGKSRKSWEKRKKGKTLRQVIVTFRNCLCGSIVNRLEIAFVTYIENWINLLDIDAVKSIHYHHRLMEAISSLVQFMCKSRLCRFFRCKNKLVKSSFADAEKHLSNKIAIVKLGQINMLSAASRLECGDMTRHSSHVAIMHGEAKKSIHVER